MDSTIGGALIAAGATVVAAAITYVATRPRKSDPSKDRRPEVYSEILADAAARRVRRNNDLRTLKFDPATEEEIRARIRPSGGHDPYAFEGRVSAIAAPDVYQAFQAARTAHLQVVAALMSKRDAADDNRAYMEANPAMPPPVDIGALSRKIRELAADAEAADDRLTELIRSELPERSAGRRRARAGN